MTDWKDAGLEAAATAEARKGNTGECSDPSKPKIPTTQDSGDWLDWPPSEDGES
jgi:hypothetical protein